MKLFERQNKGKWIAWLAVLGWMMVIFWFSAQEATDSARLSGGLVTRLVAGMQLLIPSWDPNPRLIHTLVRKGAHFFIYAVLGWLSLRAVSISGVPWRKAWLMTLGGCLLYALSDEVHQMAIPGRAGQWTDVLLDGGGSLAGILTAGRWMGQI
jgi:VanZ family protein